MPPQSCESIGQMSQTTETFGTSRETRLKMLLSLQEAFHANLLAQRPRKGLEIAMKGSYGLNALESSASYDHHSHSLRTYQGFLPLMEDEPRTEFLATFARSGMIASRTLYQLTPLAQITSETESGLLPTPMKHLQKGTHSCPSKNRIKDGHLSAHLFMTLGHVPPCEFVEAMMGYKENFTALDASEIQSFLKSRKYSSKKLES